ncbi:MAG: hypothetical protein GOV01_02685 [Candidatus Altiarchaeota archaeon]|nr:hypothetical protein [Candidatus Altiarchaeota archaeon]
MDGNTYQDTLSNLLRRKIEEARKKGTTNVDLFELIERELVVFKEELIDSLQEYLKSADGTYFEDPNPVFQQIHHSVNRNLAESLEGGWDTLYARSPYSEEQHRILKNSKVGFAGFSGSQLSSVLLARSGVGNFVIVDPDNFEPSNLNRQPLSYRSTIHKNKAETGRNYILDVNPQANVDVYVEWVLEDNVEKYFSDCDLIVVGTSDSRARPAIHDFGRSQRKPVMNVAWSGFEGQYTTFLPDDPPYTDVLGYSPITEERGAVSSGTALIHSFVAGDAIKILLSDMEHIVKYPYILTVNLLRTVPAQIRDVRYLKRHAD